MLGKKKGKGILILSNEVIQTLTGVSENIELSVLACLDDERKTIVYSSKIEKFFGYTEKELNGRSLFVLLPVSVQPTHNQLMAKMADQYGASKSRRMANRSVKAIKKDGTEIEINVAISAHQVGEDSKLFIALIQDPNEIIKQGEDLASVQNLFSSLLAPSLVTKVQKTKTAIAQAVAKKVAASGGIIGFVIWFLSSVTPLGTSLKGFIAAWQWEQKNDESGTTKLGVYERVDDELRIKNLTNIRNSLIELDPRVLAVGYFSTEFKGFQKSLRFRVDSDGIKEDVYFVAQPLTPEEQERLASFDCVQKYRLGYLPDRSNEHERIYFNGILCPTITIGIDPGDGLKVFKSKNIVAIALDPDMRESETLEPLATYLFLRAASLESPYEEPAQ